MPRFRSTPRQAEKQAFSTTHHSCCTRAMIWYERGQHFSTILFSEWRGFLTQRFGNSFLFYSDMFFFAHESSGRSRKVVKPHIRGPYARKSQKSAEVKGSPSKALLSVHSGHGCCSSQIMHLTCLLVYCKSFFGWCTVVVETSSSGKLHIASGISLLYVAFVVLWTPLDYPVMMEYVIACR